MRSLASEHSFFERWFWRQSPGKGGGRIRFIIIFPCTHQQKLAWVSPGLSWLFWLQSQLGGHEILSQLRDNQRKSESLDMNFKTLLGYPSQQAWHLSSMDKISVIHDWIPIRVTLFLWEWGLLRWCLHMYFIIICSTILLHIEYIET